MLGLKENSPNFINDYYKFIESFDTGVSENPEQYHDFWTIAWKIIEIYSVAIPNKNYNLFSFQTMGFEIADGNLDIDIERIGSYCIEEMIGIFHVFCLLDHKIIK